jgi:isopenicillin-N epimerase
MSGDLPSRRRFLRTLALGSVGVAAAPLLSPARLQGEFPSPLPLPTDLPTRGEPFWEAVRAQFPLRPGVIPMNAANLCPAPLQVIEAVERAGRDVDGDVSFQNRAQYDQLRESVRERIASFLNVSGDEIALVRNTSEGNNTIVNGLRLGPGDEVVVFDQNHPTCNVAWDVRGARAGFTVRRIAVPAPPASRGEVLDRFVSAFTPRTRAVAFSDISNTTGVRIPVRELCLEARARGIHAHVDGAQSFGAEPISLSELGCDSYSTSAHKWFMGPKEAGVLFVRSERVADIGPLAVGVGWGSGVETTAVGARKFETLGQRNDAVFAGIDAALDIHESVGIARTGARVAELAQAVKEGLRSLGAELLTSDDPELSGGVVVATFPGVDSGALHRRLYEAHGVASAPTGGLRLCPHIYNTRADVEQVLEAVARELAGR